MKRPKSIRPIDINLGTLVWATWYDKTDHEYTGGLGIVTAIPPNSPWVSILSKGQTRECLKRRLYNPKQGAEYFEGELWRGD